MEEEGAATVTLYEFNTNVELVYRDSSIEEAPELDTENYTPGGQTALHDAIARAMEETASDIAGRAAAEQPENVIVVVLTDGKENASETPQDVVRERVEARREDDGWEFLFIGANQDAALTAEQVGMDADNSLNMAHSGEGTNSAYQATSRRVSQARETGRTGGYTDEERQEQRDAEDH
jgi:hypothetical protein